MKTPDGLKAAYAAARRSGWLVTRTGSGHLKWTPSGDGTPVITGATPYGGNHATRNAVSKLRKAGLKC